ncbi:hypothetical protein KCV07_g856, partial [Aureobasidium melanogenum]
MEAITSARGSYYEGDIFAVLQKSPYVMRSFEFALADGAVDCTHRFDQSLSYAARHWQVKQRQQDLNPQQRPSDLLAFDVKSKISPVAGDQVYITTTQQRRCVAFYIGICAADPLFVELYPNYHQEQDAVTSMGDEKTEVAVNTSRVSRFHPSAYRLDPCNSPYRMPLSLLEDAIESVRSCARGEGSYVNPWTSVTFDDWKPSVTRLFKSFEPAVKTEQFTAYQAVMNIYRTLTFELHSKSQDAPLEVDFIGLQPTLADFKLITNKSGSALESSQYFVQHKRDGRDRRLNAPLSKVFVARKSNQHTRWYFTDTERFDFLFYEFSFSLGKNRPRRTEFFFLPERVIPDYFYTSESLEQDFDISEFTEFRFHMDEQGEWVHRIQRVVRDHQSPRRPTVRPRRSPSPAGVPAAGLSSASTPVPTQDPKAHSHGLRDYRSILAHRHRQFFYGLMRECALRGSGMLVILASNHPHGDFAFCHYAWTEAEKYEFCDKGSPPVTIDDLPAETPFTSVYLYSKSIETNFQGPNLSSAQFRRLNSAGEGRLLCIDLFGPDDLDSMDPILVVPTTDIQPTNGQKLVFKENLDLQKDEDFAARTPHLTSLLSTGLSAGDYSVCNESPMHTSGTWCQLWSLFMSFSGNLPFEHPTGITRFPSEFKNPLRFLNQRLREEDSRDLNKITVPERGQAGASFPNTVTQEHS